MRYFHKELAEGGWREMSLEEQMGNIASEVYRIWSRRKAGDERGSGLAFERALELVDLTLAGELPVRRLGEVARLREVLCDVYMGGGEYEETPETVNDYLLRFALLARGGK